MVGVNGYVFVSHYHSNDFGMGMELHPEIRLGVADRFILLATGKVPVKSSATGLKPTKPTSGSETWDF